MMYGFGYMPFGFFGWLFMLAFWVFVVWAIIVFVKWAAGMNRGVNPSGESSRRGPSPLEILQERYARGEITKREYDQKKADLT